MARMTHEQIRNAAVQLVVDEATWPDLQRLVRRLAECGIEITPYYAAAWLVQDSGLRMARFIIKLAADGGPVFDTVLTHLRGWIQVCEAATDADVD